MITFRSPFSPRQLLAKSGNTCPEPGIKLAPRELLTKLLDGSDWGIVLNEHYEEDGEIVFRETCNLGCEGIVSKRLGSPYRPGRSPHWLKVKNLKAPAVKREGEDIRGAHQARFLIPKFLT
jgi:hypothetical protein